MSTVRKTVHQPLHPSIRDKLDPDYVKLHDEILQYCPTTESQPWDPASRLRPSPVAFASPGLVDVGAVYDKDVEDFQVRVFVPEGEPPRDGWPCLVYFHGGGWVVGGLDSENGFLRHICKHVQCIVVSVNYRHAPEHVYPTAIEDSFAGLKWVMAPENAATLSINTSRLAVGGLSAGGGLAAICSMKASLDPAFTNARPVFQMLICPVIDSTATVESTWSTSRHSPFLTPSRMTWYRQQYFKTASDTSNWDASPCFAPPEVLATSPRTFLAIAECDLLAPEGLRYAESLKEAGVETQVQVYSGATHSVLVLAGLHKIGQALVHDACTALAKGVGGTYDAERAPVLRQGQ